ncbi:unnamed protein product [Prunus brigantina]
MVEGCGSDGHGDGGDNGGRCHGGDSYYNMMVVEVVRAMVAMVVVVAAMVVDSQSEKYFKTRQLKVKFGNIYILAKNDIWRPFRFVFEMCYIWLER